MPDLLIGNQWKTGAAQPLQSRDPATGRLVWEGHEASPDQIWDAITSARRAFHDWGQAPNQARIDALLRFQSAVEARTDELAEAISQEVGKPLWESRAEIGAVCAKVSISIEAFQERASEQRLPLSATTEVITRFRPHGVIAVFGPFNLPAHIAHGHIIPALLAGNTVVYKPSELTPWVAELMLSCWEEADLPSGVINLIQGGPEVGQALADSPEIDGLFFTGSARVGQQLPTPPGKILALEMGGNNPLIVTEVEDLQAAALLTIESAYLTAGQRCSSARRLIVPKGREGDDFLQEVIDGIDRLRIGPYTMRPEPFMGPLISTEAVDRLLLAQERLLESGGEPLRAMRRLDIGNAFASPGLIDVTSVKERADQELFGPLLQVIRVKNFQAALKEANQTAYGLVAGLLSDNAGLYEHLVHNARAGVINWNTPLTGASSRAPFGGVGQSGNFHPAGYFMVDSCHYPVASTVSRRLVASEPLKPGMAT